MAEDTLNNRQSAQVPEQDGAQKAAPEAAQKVRKGPAHGWIAWLGFVLTVGAWIMLHFNGTACFWLAVCGTLASAVALRQRNRACHNLALTALVAAVVLLVVLAIVYVALHYLLQGA